MRGEILEGIWGTGGEWGSAVGGLGCGLRDLVGFWCGGRELTPDLGCGALGGGPDWVLCRECIFQAFVIVITALAPLHYLTRTISIH